MKDNGAGPWWAKVLLTVGAPTALLAGLLGLIPGVRSPLFEIKESLGAHRVETRRLIDVFNLTCQGTWRGQPERQADCDRAAQGILRDGAQAP